MAGEPGWIALDDAVLPLSSRVSSTKAGFIGEVVDKQSRLVWASEPQSDESAADWLAASQKKAYADIRRLRALRSQR